MHQHPPHEPAARTSWHRPGPWSWRHGATVVLVGVSVPVFLVGAIVAGVVAAPLLFWLGARRVHDAIQAEPQPQPQR